MFYKELETWFTNLELLIKKTLPQRHIFCLFHSKWLNNRFSLPSGNIRNTERLSYEKQQNYRITVTAFDCGQKRAQEDVTVQIDIKPICKPGWQGQSCKSGVRITLFPFSNLGIHMRKKLGRKASLSPKTNSFWTYASPQGNWDFRTMFSQGDQEACQSSPEGNSVVVFFLNMLDPVRLPCCFACQRWQHLGSQNHTGMKERRGKRRPRGGRNIAKEGILFLKPPAQGKLCLSHS